MNWMIPSGTALLWVLASAAGIYTALIVLTRLVGLRSFSKMSSFDFAITVGFGTVVASTLLNENPPLVQGIVALCALYAIQLAVSHLRPRSTAVRRLVDNRPLLLMAGPEILHDNLRRARVTEDDLRAKLRAANVLHYEQVRAVVMETTGDISVLHAAPDAPAVDLDLLGDVRDADRLRRSLP